MSDKRKAGKPRKKMSAPRPNSYTDELGARICDLLADGQSLLAISKLPGMPNESAVRRWAMKPDHPFAEKYSQAREIGYLKMADEIIKIADDMSIDPNSRRVMVDARRYILSKCLPKVFGDKIVNNNSVNVNAFHLHTLPIGDTAAWLKTALAPPVAHDNTEEATDLPCSSND